MFELLVEWPGFSVGFVCGFIFTVMLFGCVLIDRTSKLAHAKLAGRYVKEEADRLKAEIVRMKENQ